MNEERRDDLPKRPEKRPETVSAGILKEKDKADIESRIVDTMRALGSKMTRKEILALASRMEVSHGLDELKKGLEKDAGLSEELSDEALNEVFQLIREAREIAGSGLKELKLQIGKTNPTKEYEIDRNAYLSSRFPWIKRFEESELGTNVVIDLEGFLIGAVDSAASVAKLFLALIGDLFLLPKHAYEHFRTASETKKSSDRT